MNDSRRRTAAVLPWLLPLALLGLVVAIAFVPGWRSQALVHDVQLAYAHSTQTVFYVMAGVMAATFIVSIRGLPRGRAQVQAEHGLHAEAPAQAAT